MPVTSFGCAIVQVCAACGERGSGQIRFWLKQPGMKYRLGSLVLRRNISISASASTNVAGIYNWVPNISLPVRSLDNVKYDQAKGYFELGDAHKIRTLTVNTARAFAQTLRVVARRSRCAVCRDLLRDAQPRIYPGVS
jgi:hypothetical protein